MKDYSSVASEIGYDIFRYIHSSAGLIAQSILGIHQNASELDSVEYLIPHIIRILAKYSTGTPVSELIEYFKNATEIPIDKNDIQKFEEKIVEYGVNYTALTLRRHNNFKIDHLAENELSIDLTSEILKTLSRIIP